MFGVTFKNARHKLTVERDIIFSANAIVPSQIFRKDIIKSVHDDIHDGVAVKIEITGLVIGLL